MTESVTYEKPRSRLYGVDVLRGLSILLVVLHHIHLRFQLNKYDVANLLPKSIAQFLFWSGYDGVIAFFVISGFLITRLSLSRWGSLACPRIKQFYALRIARIAPCLLLLLAVLSVLHLNSVEGFTIKPERSTLGRALVSALTFHLNWLEGHHGYLPGAWDVLWSLSVEETFYVLFPLVCFCIRSERLLVVPLVCLIVLGPFNRIAVAGQGAWEEYAYLSCMDGIAFGCLAAVVATRLKLERNLLRSLLIVGGLLYLFSMLFREQSVALGLHEVGLDITLLELGVALMLVALATGVGDAALSKATAIIRLIGCCSYEIYLTHMFVVLGLMWIVKSAPQNSTTILFWYGAMLLLSILLGYLIFRFYSEPINHALRRKFLKADIIARGDVIISPSGTA